MLSGITFCLLCGGVGLLAVFARRRWRSRLAGSAGSILLGFLRASLLAYPILTFAQSTDVLYVLGSDAKLWRETGSYQNRSLVDSHVVAFQALDATTVYVLDTNGVLWREIGSYQNRSSVDGNVDSFQALDATTVYVLGTDGTLWREIGSYQNRSSVDGNVDDFVLLHVPTQASSVDLVPVYPSREYIRLNGQVIAIENAP